MAGIKLGFWEILNWRSAFSAWKSIIKMLAFTLSLTLTSVCLTTWFLHWTNFSLLTPIVKASITLSSNISAFMWLRPTKAGLQFCFQVIIDPSQFEVYAGWVMPTEIRLDRSPITWRATFSSVTIILLWISNTALYSTAFRCRSCLKHFQYFKILRGFLEYRFLFLSNISSPLTTLHFPSRLCLYFLLDFRSWRASVGCSLIF